MCVKGEAGDTLDDFFFSATVHSQAYSQHELGAVGMAGWRRNLLVCECDASQLN